MSDEGVRPVDPKRMDLQDKKSALPFASNASIIAAAQDALPVQTPLAPWPGLSRSGSFGS
jgi:hypothetical protein